MQNDESIITIIKRLVSALEGAPFPTTVTDELYEIWYEHSREAASDALEFLARFDKSSTK